LQELLFWREVALEPSLLAAQASQELELEKLLPVKKKDYPELNLEADSVFSLLVKRDKSQRVLFEKNSEKPLPIASLTKLMTANIILENYDLNQLIEINSQADNEEGKTGFFKKGEVFKVKDLLHSFLIESSNDSVTALVSSIGEEAFVDLMNMEAKRIGLENTSFFNATGLDPDSEKDKPNLSTAKDLALFAYYLFQNQPLIFEISSIPEEDLYYLNGVFHHKLINTNKLLNEIPGIIGGKTGWTPQAKGCLLLVMRSPKNKGIIINVILGSPHRFEEMKKLIQWLKESYRW